MLQANDRRMCPGAPKPEPGDHGDPALLIRYSAEGVVVAQPKIAHRAADVGKGVEGAGAGQARHARQAVERRDHEVVPLLEGAVHVRDALLIAVERGHRRLLRDAGGIRGRLALDGASWR